jgi:hypothetical protein
MGAKMTIEKRLAKLEARTRQRGTSHREELLEKLLRIEARVVATGNAHDRPNAPLIERAVRRYLRGEVSLQTALHDLLCGN